MPAKDQIQHIVVLMLENRSFDHMLGLLRHPDRSFKGVPVDWSNPDQAGNEIPATGDADGVLPFDPHHGHESVVRQLTRGAMPLRKENIDMRGFVLDAQHTNPATGPRVMDCIPQERVPVLSALALRYAVADQWFGSVPGPTWPNRCFAHAATSDGRVNNRPYKLYDDTTIFEQLERARATWRVYRDGFPHVAAFWKLNMGNSAANFQHMDDFAAAVSANALPNYAFIEPRHFGSRSNAQHPKDNRENARDFHAGEHLIWSVYSTLLAAPRVFEKTLLVITYDEHGGFPDHEPPQDTVAPKRDMSTLGFKWDLTGVRVPAVLVSPWIRDGVVDHTIYEHASIVRSVRERFAPRQRALTRRDAAVRSWWSADIWLDAPRMDLPPIPEPAVPYQIADAAAEQSEPPTEDELAFAALAREVERMLELRADGVALEVAVAEVETMAEEEVPPFFATRAELVAYLDRVDEKLR